MKITHKVLDNSSMSWEKIASKKCDSGAETSLKQTKFCKLLN